MLMIYTEGQYSILHHNGMPSTTAITCERAAKEYC